MLRDVAQRAVFTQARGRDCVFNSKQLVYAIGRIQRHQVFIIIL